MSPRKIAATVPFLVPRQWAVFKALESRSQRVADVTHKVKVSETGGTGQPRLSARRTRALRLEERRAMFLHTTCEDLWRLQKNLNAKVEQVVSKDLGEVDRKFDQEFEETTLSRENSQSIHVMSITTKQTTNSAKLTTSRGLHPRHASGRFRRGPSH